MKAKKLLTMILAFAMTLTMAAAAVNGAGEDVKVFVNDNEITFEAPPRIVNDFTLVPFRAIFEALGYEVDWNQEAQTVTGLKGDITLTMVIGKTEATVKNSAADASEAEKTVTFDVPPQIIDDFTFVPVRAVGEMSNYKVDWDNDARKVLITSPADITTGSGPAMPTASPDPTTQTAPGPVVSQFPITYDDTNERESHNVRGFELTSVEKNAEGKYDITFTLKTFFEGRGTVAASFDCLDANGKVIDGFGNSYVGSDYAWTPHEDKATISGNTVKIVFRLDN